MTAVKQVQIVTRSERQAAECKVWVQEAADYLVHLGVYGPEELQHAHEYASNLCSQYRDDGGELMDTPKDAVDEDLTYYAG